jgi:hypothetical protein
MENQNLASEGKKKFCAVFGRKQVMIRAGLAVLLLIGIPVRGSASRANRQMLFAGGAVTLAAQNFESLGIVFAEPVSARRRDGHGMIHNALMMEAAQLGADAIVNVSISSSGGRFSRTWHGSALAVRFLDTATDEN